MMSRKTRQGMLLLGVLSFVSFWAARDRVDPNARLNTDLDTRLNYALRDFQLLYFDARGRPAVNMRAPQFSNDAATGIGTVVNPELDIHHEGLLWHIVADSATVTSAQDQVFLGGKVSLLREGQQPLDQMQIHTEDVLLYIESRIASSDRTVDVVDVWSHMQATGFSLDMINNSYQLKHNVKGTYGIQ